MDNSDRFFTLLIIGLPALVLFSLAWAKFIKYVSGR